VNNREERKDTPKADADTGTGDAGAGTRDSGLGIRKTDTKTDVAPTFRSASGAPKAAPPATTYAAAPIQNQEDAPPCSMCGSIMVRSGSCYKCANCGSTSGCA